MVEKTKKENTNPSGEESKDSSESANSESTGTKSEDKQSEESSSEESQDLMLIEGGDYRVRRLPPFVDATYTNAWTREERSDLTKYLALSNRTPQEVYAQMEEPMRKVAEEAEKESEGLSYYVNDLQEGMKRYLNDVVKTSNSMFGTELNEFTEKGELGALGTFVDEGWWSFALPFVLGPIPGGVALFAENLVQAHKPEMQQLYAGEDGEEPFEGFFNMGIDAVQAKFTGEYLDGHALLGKMPEKPQWQDVWLRMTFDEFVGGALFMGGSKLLRNKSFRNSVKQFAKDESGTLGLPSNNLPTGVNKKKAKQTAEMIGEVLEERVEATPEDIKKLIRNPKLHKTIHQAHQAHRNGQLAINATNAVKRLGHTIDDLKTKYPKKMTETTEAVTETVSQRRDFPANDEFDFYDKLDEFLDKSKRGTSDENRVQSIVEAGEAQQKYLKKGKEGKTTVTGEEGDKTKYTTSEQQTSLKAKTGLEGIGQKDESKTLAIVEQMRRITDQAMKETNPDIQKGLLSIHDTMEVLLGEHGTATGKRLSYMAKAKAYLQGSRELLHVTRERLARAVTQKEREKILNQAMKANKAMGEQSKMSMLGADAVQVSNRLLINNFVGRGALEASVMGNTVAAINESVYRLVRNPTHAPGLIYDAGVSLASAVLSHLKPSTWMDIGRRVARGGGGALAEETATIAKTRVGKLGNLATGTNFFVLEATDNFMSHAARNVVGIDALERGVKRRIAAGWSYDDIAEELQKLSTKDHKYLGDVAADLVYSYEDRVERMAMRGKEADVFAPTLARPLWWARDVAKTAGYKAGPTMGAIAERLSVFSRTGAGIMDYMSRNSALRFLDVLAYKRVRGLELDRAIIGQGQISLGMWGLVNMQQDDKGRLPVKLQQTSYGKATGSRDKANAFRVKQGVRIGGKFVELNKLGHIGEYQRIQKIALESIERAMLNGDMNTAERIGQGLWDFTTAAIGEQWFVQDFLALMTLIDRGGQGSIKDAWERGEMYEHIVAQYMPFGTDLNRYWTAKRGARPSGNYLDAQNALNDQMAVQVNPFGRPMDGIDRATRFMEGSEEYWKKHISRFQMFLNPNSPEIYDVQTEELNNFLLETGAFHNNDYYIVVRADGTEEKIHKEAVGDTAKQTMRPYRSNAEYAGAGSVRLSEIDKNKARILLSLDVDQALGVFDSWHSQVEQIQSDNEYIDALKDQFNNGALEEGYRALRESFEDSGMGEDEDTTAFFHRIATAPLDELPPDLVEQIETYKEYYHFQINKPLDYTGIESRTREDFDEQFLENMARKHIITNFWDIIETTVHGMNVYAPSAIEQINILHVPQEERAQ